MHVEIPTPTIIQRLVPRFNRGVNHDLPHPTTEIVSNWKQFTAANAQVNADHPTDETLFHPGTQIVVRLAQNITDGGTVLSYSRTTSGEMLVEVQQSGSCRVMTLPAATLRKFIVEAA